MKKPLFEKLLKYWWLGGVALASITSLSLAAMASVPAGNAITDDTALYQNLSEIRVNREGRVNFDSEIRRLSMLEDNYREKLPALSVLSQPIKRISTQKYRYASGRKAVRQAKPVRR